MGRKLAFFKIVFLVVTVYLTLFTLKPSWTPNILEYPRRTIKYLVKLSSEFEERSQLPLATLKNFTFVIDCDVCGEDPIELLVLIGSHPSHRALRNLFRETWTSPPNVNYKTRLVFFFGVPDDPSEGEIITNESISYGDIVQGNFRDAYHNVTFRDLMGLRWTWSKCPQARFVMHADDDIAMDVGMVVDALQKQVPPRKGFIACSYQLIGTPVLRSGRYAMTKEEYENDTYPTYCNGWWYWMTPEVAKLLDFASQRVRPFWINDAYITGALVKEINWTHTSLNVPFYTNSNQVKAIMRKNNSDTPPPFAIVTTGADIQYASDVQYFFRNLHVR